MAEAFVQGGLTQAEIMKNSLDVFGNQEAHPAVVRFHNKYIDEIGRLKEQIITFGELELAFNKHEEPYKKLLDEQEPDGIVTEYDPCGKRKLTEIGSVIMHAAGGFISEKRLEVFAERSAYLDAADVFSRGMASYLTKYLESRTVTPINGTTYFTDEGYMTKRRPKKDGKQGDWIYTIFGNNDTLIAFNKKYYGQKGSGSDRKDFPELALPKDWLQLFDDLEKTSSF